MSSSSCIHRIMDAESKIRQGMLSSGRRGFGGGEVVPALGHCLKEFVAFAQTAHADIVVFKHRLHDAQDGLGAQVIAAIELLYLLKNFFLREARIFESGLLEAVPVDDISLVFLGEPTIL